MKEKIGKFCPNMVILIGAYFQTQNKQLLNFSAGFGMPCSALALIKGARLLVG